MKIATFNINNINKRLPNLLDWLKSSSPDVVCLQELKSTDRDFPAEALRKAGYGAVWRGERSWNGVAILARGAEPVLIRDELPGDPKIVKAVISRRPSAVSSSPRFICQTGTRSRARNSTTSLRGSIG